MNDEQIVNNKTTATTITTKKRDRSPSTAIASDVTTKKEKQRPETWNKIEQQIFFNALRQNGKNFEALTQYFNTRQKRYKINAVQRSKEQIRHFYYRTWHKINKYIQIPHTKEQHTRDVQISCLIGFNLLMNKSFRWNKKSAIKLVELINHGWTTVRKKGKIARLKMPLLKSYTNTNTIVHNQEANAGLPSALTIQLQPKNNSAYVRVHGLAQNPFVEVSIQSMHSIKYLIDHLETKWKDRQSITLERLTNLITKKTHNLVLYIDSNHHNLTQLDNYIYFIANNADDGENTTIEGAKISISDASPELSSSISIKIKLKSSADDTSKSANKKNDDEDVAMASTTEDEIIHDKHAQPQHTQSHSKSKKLSQIINRLQIDSLKQGLTSSNSDLTFMQIYLALKKPSIIRLVYEWVPIDDGKSLDLESIDRQKYYIDVLSRVAHAFLVDKSKEISKFTQNTSQDIVSVSNQISHVVNQTEKIKKPRQKKALIVKNSRLAIGQELPPPPQNIVMCNPMQGIARQIISYSDDDSSSNNRIKQNNTSLMSFTNNNDTHFIDSNSNMSNLSGFLDTCKSILGVPLHTQNHSQVNNKFSAFEVNVNTTNYTTTSASSFKRIDTSEWNEVLGDLSLTGFMTEYQSPEKNKNPMINNDNSRDSLFFNMDSMMDISLTSAIGNSGKAT